MLPKWAWLSVIPSLSFGTVNVYLSSSAPSQLQNDFIANATTQFSGNLVASPYFSGTYSLTISGKKSVPVITVSSPIFTSTAVDELLANGWGLGQLAERDQELKSVTNFQAFCSSPTYFSPNSTATWDADTCYFALKAVSDFIFLQNFGTTTIHGVP